MIGSPTTGARVSLDVKSLLAKAEACLRRGQSRDAEALCRQVLSQNEQQADALHLLGIIALQSGQPGTAREYLERAARSNDRNPDIQCNFAAALLSLNCVDDGMAALNRAVMLAPSHPQAHYNLGLIQLRQGEFARAKRHFERTIKRAPEHVDAIVALGVAFTQTGEFEQAARLFGEALALRPNHPDARLNLANALTELGRIDEAVAHYSGLLRANPAAPNVHFHLALAFVEDDRFPEAVESYRAAIRLDPNHANAHCNLSRLLCRKGETNEAVRHIEAAIALRPDDRHLLTNVAATYTEMGRPKLAQRVWQNILAVAPADPEANFGMIAALQDAGHFSEAESFIDSAAQRVSDPTVATVLKCYRLFSDKTIPDDEIASLHTLADDPALTDRHRVRIHFALGAIHHARHDHDLAFRHYGAGNTIKNQSYDYDPDGHDRVVEAIITTFGAEVFRRRGEIGTPSRRPVIVVGMPRSGTTLSEQILASHSAAAGAGELPILAYSLEHELPFKMDRRSDYPTCVLDITKEMARDITDGYLARLDSVSDSAERVVDKMPENYLHLGAIALLFPNASIVHCRREPQATALSIFFQNFTGNHPYAWDLHNIGRRYRSYRRLMDHWNAVLPSPIFELDYEELVSDQEGTSRCLLAFCGLAWEDRVLQFHETERSVRTASGWQVRQRLYADAVDAWRHYEHHLASLEAGLAGKDVGTGTSAPTGHPA